MTTLYFVLLGIHNINRWVLLVVAIWTLVLALRGLKASDQVVSFDGTRQLQKVFLGSVHLQLLLGLMLFAVMGMGKIPVFAGSRPSFEWEHLFFGVVVAIIATVGSVRSKKLSVVTEQHKTIAITTATSLVLALLAIPWWRGLFPNFGN